MNYNYNPLKQKKTDNLGLRSDMMLGQFISEHGTSSAKQAYGLMQTVHESFFDAVDKIMGDDRLTDNAKQWTIGKKGMDARKLFESNANALQREMEAFKQSVDGSLYSNSVQLSQNDQILLGVVAQQINEKGLQYVHDVPFIHPVATLLAKANVVSEPDLIIDHVNRVNTPDKVELLNTINERQEALEATIQEERSLIDAHTPTESSFAKLDAQAASQEIRTITEGV